MPKPESLSKLTTSLEFQKGKKTPKLPMLKVKRNLLYCPGV